MMFNTQTQALSCNYPFFNVRQSTIFTVNTTTDCLRTTKYGKRDFAEAVGHKAEIGERCTRRRRGGGRDKQFHTGPERRNLAKESENQSRIV